MARLKMWVRSASEVSVFWVTHHWDLWVISESSWHSLAELTMNLCEFPQSNLLGKWRWRNYFEPCSNWDCQLLLPINNYDHLSQGRPSKGHWEWVYKTVGMLSWILSALYFAAAVNPAVTGHVWMKLWILWWHHDVWSRYKLVYTVHSVVVGAKFGGTW